MRRGKVLIADGLLEGHEGVVAVLRDFQVQVAPNLQSSPAIPLTGGPIEIVFPGLVNVEVRLLDARTGRRIHAPFHLAVNERVLRSIDSADQPAGTARYLIGTGGVGRLRVHPELPEGMTTDPLAPASYDWLDARADRHVIHVPVYPEARIEIDPEFAEEWMQPKGAHVLARLRPARETLALQVERGEHVVRVRGVPHVPGSRVFLWAREATEDPVAMFTLPATLGTAVSIPADLQKATLWDETDPAPDELPRHWGWIG